MNKSDKKIEKALCKTLTVACESLSHEFDGFVWLTHLVNYHAFPQSLIIVCVFEREIDLSNVINRGQDEYLRNLINRQLSSINIQLDNTKRQIRLDSEEACDIENDGNWAARFDRVTLH